MGQGLLLSARPGNRLLPLPQRYRDCRGKIPLPISEYHSGALPIQKRIRAWYSLWLYSRAANSESMDVTAIPFVATVGIRRMEDGSLTVPFTHATHNHLGTIHASAQFALAETASGDALQRLFPDLIGKVVPVLRDSTLKFKRPAMADLRAAAMISEEAVARFRDQFKNKGRASIAVNIVVSDAQGIVTCIGTFEWFVQSLETGMANQL